MHEIRVRGSGRPAVVDEAFADRLSGISWGLSSGRYALGRVGGRTVSMHRMVIDCPNGLVIDHINGDGLDNRLSNLRTCTHAQNMCNRTPKGRFLGVVRRSDQSCSFRAQISKGGKSIKLGTFATQRGAALAYDHAARRLHGKFANLNFPKITTTDDLVDFLRTATKPRLPHDMSLRVKAVEMANQGAGAKEISKSISVPYSTVCGWLSELRKVSYGDHQNTDATPGDGSPLLEVVV